MSAPEAAGTTRVSRWQLAIGIAGLAVTIWVGGELYDVATADAPASRRHGPTEPGDRDDPTTPTTGAHDPSRFGH